MSYAGMFDGWGFNDRFNKPPAPAPIPYWQTVEGQREQFEQSLLSQEQQRRQYDSETQRNKYGILQGLIGNAFGGGMGGGFGGGGGFSSGWGRGSGGIVKRPITRKQPSLFQSPAPVPPSAMRPVGTRRPSM